MQVPLRIPLIWSAMLAALLIMNGFLKAKKHADSHPGQPKLITINAWNEWVEGSYLLPDMLNGFEYLEAVRTVMNGKYDRYTNQTLQKR